MTRAWRLRPGPGALIVLVHVVLAALLVRYAGTPPTRGEQDAAQTSSFDVVLVTAKPEPVTQPVVAKPVLRKRPATVRRVRAPAPDIVQVADSREAGVQEAQPEQAAAQGNRLDMEALRSAARHAEQERLPTALERLRESEQMRRDEDSALARGIQRAKRPNCQTAYAAGRTTLNVLLLIPIAIDTISGKGCKW